jgi:NAD(P)-dependent dehydrogenase (short-subunit alcohol dehydrogenase family)
MDLELAGKVAIITGATQGIGQAKSMPTTVSRAAGQAMSKALSKELAPDGILVNTVCIGLVRAGQHDARAARQGVDTESLYQDMGRTVPLGRVGRADEAADVIAFLVSARASFVTGSSINIDGGASAEF